MKCHYEVLNLERSADDAEIKTAYRKLALRWHPDKNLADQETAKEQFQLVQQAYEVLSDSHERAWYDNHREQILRGGQSNYEDKSLDLFQYFTVSCFKGFGDDNQGFYAVYQNVFETIASEDSEFVDDDEDFNPPTFGTSTSNYDKVVGPFYAYWQSYCTRKSYAWLCPHNIKDIRDRRIVREIEKENKKIQQKAKRERNEEIRALVSFIRKRDKRVQLNKRVLEERVAANRLKNEQKRLEQIRSRQKELAEQKHTNKEDDEAYQQQLRQLENAYASDEDEDASDDEEGLESPDGEVVENGDAIDEEIILDDLYCVACNKSFRNSSSYKNHESSKKHWDNIKKLKEEMLAEEDLDEEHLTSDLSDLEIEPEIVKSNKKSKKTKRKAKLLKTEIDISDNENKSSVENEDAEIDEALVEDVEQSSAHDASKDISEEMWDNKSTKKKNKQKKTAKQNGTKEFSIAENAEANFEENGEVVESVKESFEAPKDDSDDDWGNKSIRKKGKPKKTVKSIDPKTAQPLAKETKLKGSKVNKKKPIEEDDDDFEPVDTDHTCVTCKTEFDSKNKLFSHLKNTGHGVYLDKLAAAAGVHVQESSKRGRKKK